MPGKRKHSEKWDHCWKQVQEQGHSEESAAAICTAALGDESFAAAEEHEEPRFVTLLGATGAVRRERWRDRDWTVVPVVALVEGVIHAVNAPEPELVRANLFPQALAEWEEKPVFAGHPMKDGVPIDGLLPDVLPASFGLVRNAAAHAKALNMEAWLDHARCAADTPGGRVLARVTAQPPRPVEVSVGAWTYVSRTAGVWSNGKRYAAEWVGWKPNHLALLEHQRGACNLEMGCGTHRVAMRVAEDRQSAEVEMPEKKDGVLGRFAAFFRSLMPRGWGDDEVKQELREALEAVEPLMRTGGEIVRVKNDAVIYCLYPPLNYYDAPMGPMAKMTYWQRDYSFDAATQKFAVSSERTQVEPATVYLPYKVAGAASDVQEPTPKAPCACGNHAAVAAGESPMTKEERIAALAANPHSPVKSLKMLAAAEDAELTDLETRAAAAKKAADEATLKAVEDKKAADKKAADEKAAADLKATNLKAAEEGKEKPEPDTEEQVLARMPGLKAIVDGHRAAVAAQTAELIAGIRAASQVYTEEQLKAKDLDELQRIAVLAKAEVPKDYSGLPIPRAAASSNDLSSFAPPDPYAKDLAASAK